MKSSTVRHGMNLWPPFLFSGIHITDISDDWRHVRVELRKLPWNGNYVNTHFGGSLFAMTDPFRMIPVLRCLEPHRAHPQAVVRKAEIGTLIALRP